MMWIDDLFVVGEHDADTIQQMRNCMAPDCNVCGALMADGHLGYSAPIGSVLAYSGHVSPSAVGYDIACGNKAVLLDADAADVRANIGTIMDDIWAAVPIGLGEGNDDAPDHDLFDDPAWGIPAVGELRDAAREQLGSVGSGNHYVDVFVDDSDRVWAGVHFGSRGLGHKIATHYVKAGGGKNGMMADPVLLDVESELGAEYLAAMTLAGRYAYAGRDWVCARVAELIGATILDEVHNHHNFAWLESHNGRDVWVVRKGATPAFPWQRGFVGGSMGDVSVILEGTDHEDAADMLHSTVHGAGRVMSRSKAAGKSKWRNGRRERVSDGAVSQDMMDDWLTDFGGVELRGGGLDESPHCYRRLPDVLNAQGATIKVNAVLTPIGVAMAGA